MLETVSTALKHDAFGAFRYQSASNFDPFWRRVLAVCRRPISKDYPRCRGPTKCAPQKCTILALALGR